MTIKIVKDLITKFELQSLAKKGFGDLVKAVVDVEQEIIAIGGDLHADEEAVLLENGSKQENLWGINIYPFLDDNSWIKFDPIINIRPSLKNRSRNVEDPQTREKILKIIEKLTK